MFVSHGLGCLGDLVFVYTGLIVEVIVQRMQAWRNEAYLLCSPPFLYDVWCYSAQAKSKGEWVDLGYVI